MKDNKGVYRGACHCHCEEFICPPAGFFCGNCGHSSEEHGAMGVAPGHHLPINREEEMAYASAPLGESGFADISVPDSGYNDISVPEPVLDALESVGLSAVGAAAITAVLSAKKVEAGPKERKSPDTGPKDTSLNDDYRWVTRPWFYSMYSFMLPPFAFLGHTVILNFDGTKKRLKWLKWRGFSQVWWRHHGKIPYSEMKNWTLGERNMSQGHRTCGFIKLVLKNGKEFDFGPSVKIQAELVDKAKWFATLSGTPFNHWG